MNSKDIEMPNNILSEKAIISFILIYPDKFLELGDYLTAVDFYSLPHQYIWKAMSTLYKLGEDLDIVSIKTELIKENIDPKPSLHSLTACLNENSTFDGNYMGWAKEVKNKSMLRQIIKVISLHSDKCRLDSASALTTLTDIEKEIVDICDNIKDDHPTDAEGIINEVNADIARGEEIGWQGFDTRFPILDEQTGGLIPKQVWIVGAYTGVGKTFFCLQMLLNVLRGGAKVMLVSTEMDRKMNMMRLIGNLAGLGTIKMLKGIYAQGERERMAKAQVKLSTYKNSLNIFDNVYTTEEIRLKAKKVKLKEGLDVLFVDFIQNLRGSENIYERMSNASIELQKIAQELNITVVIASQVTQSSAGWKKGSSSIDYKGAGEIAAIADVGLWINKVDEEPESRMVMIRKVRHGMPKKFNIKIKFPSGRITDAESEGNIMEDGNVAGQL